MISFSQYLKEGDYPLYHKTFTSAAKAALDLAKKRGFEVDEDDWFNQVSTGPKKPGKGKTNRYIVKVTKNGKETRKRLAFQVYGMDSGKYELNAYVESTQIQEGKGSVIDQIKTIVSDKQASKIGGKMIDMQTASVISQIYDKVSVATKKKMENDKIENLVKIAQRVMAKESTELEEAIKVKTHRGMYSMKKGEESLRNWVDGIVIMSDAVKKNQRKTVAQNIVKAIETGKIKNADLTQDLGTLIGVKAPSGMEAPKSVVKDRMKELKLLESTDKDLDIKSIKDLIKNPSPKMIKQYGGKDKYIKMLKSKLAKLESIKENIGVEDGRRVVVKALTKPAALRLQKKLRNKFNSYDFNIDKSGLSIIVPNEKHITRFINKQPEVDTIGESVDFEKTNTLTVDEYDEVQNFQNFNKKDWRFDKKSKTYTRKKKV
jgi:DnaJ-domain-containing protein 1